MRHARNHGIFLYKHGRSKVLLHSFIGKQSVADIYSFAGNDQLNRNRLCA